MGARCTQYTAKCSRTARTLYLMRSCRKLCWLVYRLLLFYILFWQSVYCLDFLELLVCCPRRFLLSSLSFFPFFSFGSSPFFFFSSSSFFSFAFSTCSFFGLTSTSSIISSRLLKISKPIKFIIKNIQKPSIQWSLEISGIIVVLLCLFNS